MFGGLVVQTRCSATTSVTAVSVVADPLETQRRTMINNFQLMQFNAYADSSVLASPSCVQCSLKMLRTLKILLYLLVL